MSQPDSNWSVFMKKSQKSQLKTKSKPKPKPQKRTRKRKINPTANTTHFSEQPPPKKRKLSNIQQITCPMCNKKLLSNLINFHMEKHFRNNLNIKQNNSNKNKNKINKSEIETKIETKIEKKEIKICPLFTSGALPSSMFTKSKRMRNNTKSAQNVLFYLNITTDSNEQHITSWNAKWITNKDEINKYLNNASNKSEYCTDVMIREPNTIGLTKIYLSTNYNSNINNTDIVTLSSEFSFNNPSPNNLSFSPSLIKSLLQKCIRLSRDMSAVKASYLLLLKDSFQSLLRRLSIIIIEDVILFTEYIPLIWLLLANSKSNINQKYYPKICWYNFIFELVKKCAKCNIKDYIKYELYPNDTEYINLFTKLQSDNNVNDDIQNNDDDDMKQLLIRTMLIRASYGGMKCDVAMLRSYACIWHNRFYGETKHCNYYKPCLAKLIISNQKRRILLNNCNNNNNNNWLSFIKYCSDKYKYTMNMKKILPICSDDLILSSVDFHCSNMLKVLCNNRNGKVWKILNAYLLSNNSSKYNNNNTVEGLLKLLVWEFRSSTTNKYGLLMDETKPDELRPLWESIKPAINDYATAHYRYRKH